MFTGGESTLTSAPVPSVSKGVSEGRYTAPGGCSAKKVVSRKTLVFKPWTFNLELGTLIPMSNALVIFAKAPLVGQVKTRLCPPLSLEEAAELARCFLVDMVERACRLPTVRVYLAIT